MFSFLADVSTVSSAFWAQGWRESMLWPAVSSTMFQAL